MNKKQSRTNTVKYFLTRARKWGFNQQKIANAVGVSRRTVSRWLRNGINEEQENKIINALAGLYKKELRATEVLILNHGNL